MRYLITAVIVASLSLVAVAAAQAVPSVTISNVVVPTGEAPDITIQDPAPTTWHVDVAGDAAWQYVACQSSSHWPDPNEPDVEGEDISPNQDADHWVFKANTATKGEELQVDPWWHYVYLPLNRITASCKLSRDVYLGKRWYRRMVSFDRYGSTANSRRPNGCRIYSWSAGRLSIDCRHSRTSGSASWRFRVRPSDWGGRYGLYFNRLESTMGPHKVTAKWTGPRTITVTETVSPRTMITVDSVYLNVKRLYSKRVYRHEARTFYAAWPS